MKIIYNTSMTIEQVKQISEAIDLGVEKWSNILQDFPKGQMGLTPDSVKKTFEYKNAKQGFRNSFRTLQIWNKSIPKKLKRQLAEERRDLKIAMNK